MPAAAGLWRLAAVSAWKISLCCMMATSFTQHNWRAVPGVPRPPVPMLAVRLPGRRAGNGFRKTRGNRRGRADVPLPPCKLSRPQQIPPLLLAVGLRAGAGRTERLATRYLRLIGHRASPAWLRRAKGWSYRDPDGSSWSVMSRRSPGSASSPFHRPIARSGLSPDPTPAAIFRRPVSMRAGRVQYRYHPEWRIGRATRRNTST